ncbi:MAG: NAD(P)H-dependent glycerol-3-phosphate dehydrogenase [Porticoccaceae bacterium]|nr:NAD(P)H-dependent glycerol-3-phosphate dehydrogenase [Porticoccaceae bacterium]MDP4752856.1 NAD(P)H-dependent glycerol-3-phosphate dehydrogenase [Porticoccaceae bacterium]
MTQSKHKIAVLGGGSFGTVIANILAANGHATTLWMRSAAQAQQVASSGENAAYLPGYKLDSRLVVTADLAQSLKGADSVFFAIPSSAFRSVAKQAKPFIASGAILVSMAKGIEAETFLLPSQILESELPGHPVGVISGPNLAKEIANKEITATVIGSADDELCSRVQRLLASRYFRVYANHDRYGVELAGALKNIYAIVAGIAEAMKAGQNTKSVVLTRSLAEMSRFACKLGADPLTFLGLSGVGDLYVTCTSPLSRNFRVGLALGEGKSLDQAMSDIGQVAEGVNTTKLVKERADEMGIYMPLASALYAYMFEQRPILESMRTMMVAEQNTDVEFMVKPNER